MDEDTNILKLLKWVGIAALVAIPIYFIVKHVTESEKVASDYDDDNIFAAELE
ncbi:MAG: hypothetical protein KKF20_00975 [Bacteroidetes bacterium]|jgi:uncharacterized membrane protein YjfL (UPF0719 family)|nr:hypothetical protein [Bacteroidota bacterium]MBU1421736.1 hypothetical protein [Bacteroidota bacterium]MBU2470965.1 hypothetical protein [Bacteroidota bacterium]MBU2636045.1 hypothetical protein [Bacteroidota bacterium]MDI6778592.1 hypothetical protein [Bacteroidota bacterium]